MSEKIANEAGQFCTDAKLSEAEHGCESDTTGKNELFLRINNQGLSDFTFWTSYIILYNKKVHVI
ncbi:hypothetical protein X274_03870 [Marinitoga sp. 1155]|nr:hypothetical protein X274_03870 [Marinitoga sp. 1155]NUU99759.1 hypothetical protein [Marinitoga sp. 1154]